MSKCNSPQQSDAIAKFREYLRIPSVHPKPDYGACLDFLKKYVGEADLSLETIVLPGGNPLGIVTWRGTEPNLPSVLLSSHMDVVPVVEEFWTHKPFDADMDEKGDIYARGAQDMKCVTIQYIEAIKRLKRNGIALKRTVHLIFTPDEEIGSQDGMQAFVRTDVFKNLNAGVALDEGYARNDSAFNLAYGSKCVWQVRVHCPGVTGHGSTLLSGTAGPKLTYMLNKFNELRNEEAQKIKENPHLEIGDITTVNVTLVTGGSQGNVLPAELQAVADFRIPGNQANDDFENMLNKWCAEAGEGVRIEFEIHDVPSPYTELNPSNPWWLAFKRAMDEMKLEMLPLVMPGVADSRFLRQYGIPAFNFSPINNTELLLHAHNEYLNASVFLKGIDIYEKLIIALANV